MQETVVVAAVWVSAVKSLCWSATWLQSRMGATGFPLGDQCSSRGGERRKWNVQLLWWLHVYHFKIHRKKSQAKSCVRISVLQYWSSVSELLTFFAWLTYFCSKSPYTVVFPYIQIESMNSKCIINIKFIVHVMKSNLVFDIIYVLHFFVAIAKVLVAILPVSQFLRSCLTVYCSLSYLCISDVLSYC